MIETIRNSQDQILYQAKPLTACPTCQPEELEQNNSYAARYQCANAFLITSALHDALQHGTEAQGQPLPRKDLVGKTGTTQNQVDAWFAGYNSDIVAIAWMGFDQQQHSLHEYGVQSALPMWTQFMRTALQGRPERIIEQPPGIVSIRIDPLTGKRASTNDPVAKFEYFMFPYVPDEDQNTVSQDNTLAPEIAENDEVY